MVIQAGYFLQLRTIAKTIKINVIEKRVSPFFSTLDDDKIVKLFLEALINRNHEEAYVYISKNCTYEFDFEELSDFFDRRYNYIFLLNALFYKEPKNCKTKSLLVMKNTNNIEKGSVIHFKLIKEQNKFGKWKIYGIEKE